MSRTVERVIFPTPIPKAIRVAAYARVSSGKDAMLHSLAAQVDHYSTYIRHHPGWEYVGVYADEAKTGTKASRENFQRLLADCRDGKIDRILTKSISRFARNTVTLLETVRELKGLGISVYFEEQNIDTETTGGELVLSFLASFAQEETLSTSENQKWRVRRNFENGMPWNGTMLGYRYDRGTLIAVPGEAQVVKLIFDSYLCGMGGIAIAKLLNAKGIPSRFGNIWSESSVMRVLNNYAYTGNLLLQKTYRQCHITKRRRVNEGEFPMYHVQNAHEPIIPLEQFNAVQEEIKRRAAKYTNPGDSKNRYPFTGRITCACCGKHYRRKLTAGGPVWICSTFNTRGKSACPSKQIPEGILLAATNEFGGVGNITAVTAHNGNLLEFVLADGTTATHRWQGRSRAASWTPEMRKAAGEKTRERNLSHAES